MKILFYVAMLFAIFFLKISYAENNDIQSRRISLDYLINYCRGWQDVLNHENEIGRISGFVNAEKKYKAGKAIADGKCNESMKDWEKEFFSLGGKEAIVQHDLDLEKKRQHDENSAPGTPERLRSKIQKMAVEKLNYPSKALRNGEEGTVIVALKIDRLGNILNAALKIPCKYETLNEEAINVFKRLGKFPAVPDEIKSNSQEFEMDLDFYFKIN